MSERFIFDTNVIISAVLIAGSISALAFDKAKKLSFIIQSPATLYELEDVILRKKFDKYVTSEKRLRFLYDLKDEVIIIEPTVTITVYRDPKDNKYLELAIASKANCIVTGDIDLLVLNPFRDIPILTPRQFLDQS